MDNTARLNGPQPAVLKHPRFVKSILPSPNGLPYIVTGSDDEDLRVWDVSTIGDAEAQPLSVVSGHCGDITALATWVKEENGKKTVSVVSASLDGTLRRWTMKGLLTGIVSILTADLLNPVPLSYEPVKSGDSLMTEEEERELAELMSDDD
jgi:WD40 repeat protein